MPARRLTISTIISFSDGNHVTKSMPGLYFADMANELLGELKTASAGRAREYIVLIAQATALEALLNDEIILAAIHVFGLKVHQDHSRALLGVPIKDKLVLTPPFVTRNRFVLNRASAPVQALLAMISRRNKVVHSVAEFEPFDPDAQDTRPKSELVLEVTIEELTRYAQGLNAFVEQFVLKTDRLDELSPNDILLNNEAGTCL